MIKIGDLVTRKKYKNDIIFRISNIDKNKVVLTGVDTRIIADTNFEDINKINTKETINNKNSIELDINNYFYIPGKILHLDSDINYLNECEKYYNNLKIKNYCFLYKEIEYKKVINNLIQKTNPDIVVITGHDSRKKDGKYRNSNYFIETVKEIRKINNKIIIISGACQSNYESLIKAGSTFSSSPERINIKVLDPSIIASTIALSNVNEVIPLKSLLNKTECGPQGIGGFEIKGVMKIGYPKLGNNKDYNA